MAYCLFCTQGHMTLKEFKQECLAGRWLPILVMRANNEIIVPIFDTASIAGKFVARNLPSNWECGVIAMQIRDAQMMDERGWKAIKFVFPRKLKDLVDFDIEILEFPPDHKLRIQV